MDGHVGLWAPAVRVGGRRGDHISRPAHPDALHTVGRLDRPNSMSTPTHGALAPGSKIMSLKFMQRRQSNGGASIGRPSIGSSAAGTPTQPLSAAAATPSSTGSAAAGAATSAAGGGNSDGRSIDTEWTLDAPSRGAAGAGAPPRPRVLLEEDIGIAASQDDGSAAALLTFNAGRRSFGSFNPRLEKRLAEIGSNQRTVRQEQQNAAQEAEERRKKAAEHEDLMRRADADEAKERQNSVSDAELAASFAKKYGKYLPAPAQHEVRGVQATTMPPPKPPPLPAERFGNDAFAGLPPVASNPVKMRDEPAAKRSKKHR